MARTVLIVNMKTYPNAFGRDAEDIAAAAAQVAEEYSDKVRIIIAAPALSAYRIRRYYDDVFIQHADPVGLGAHTGSLPVEAVALEGYRGVLVNHSERKLPARSLPGLIAMARDHGLETVTCADDYWESASIALLSPDMIAVEPPDLIGTGVSVSSARPEVVERSLEVVRRLGYTGLFLVGAGVSTGSDASKALELGAEGVLVASAVMKSPSPREKIRELAAALAGEG